MNNKRKKIISFVGIVLFIIMQVSMCFAEDISVDSISGKDSSVATANIGTVGNKIATIIRNVGIVLAVIVLMILGIKYMMGSAEEKAEYKKSMIPYIVGTVVLFGASQIAAAIVGFAS